MNPLKHAPLNTYPVMDNPFQTILDLQREQGEMLRTIMNMIGQPVIVSDKMSIEQASEYLDLSTSTLYKMTAMNTIPFTKRAGSKKLIFSQLALEAWNNNHQKTSKELAQELIHLKIRKAVAMA